MLLKSWKVSTVVKHRLVQAKALFPASAFVKSSAIGRLWRTLHAKVNDWIHAVENGHYNQSKHIWMKMAKYKPVAVPIEWDAWRKIARHPWLPEQGYEPAEMLGAFALKLVNEAVKARQHGWNKWYKVGFDRQVFSRPLTSS